MEREYKFKIEAVGGKKFMFTTKADSKQDAVEKMWKKFDFDNNPPVAITPVSITKVEKGKKTIFKRRYTLGTGYPVIDAIGHTHVGLRFDKMLNGCIPIKWPKAMEEASRPRYKLVLEYIGEKADAKGDTNSSKGNDSPSDEG